MNTFLICLAVIAYLAIAMGVKVYYKLNRWDNILNEEPYIIGLFWPIYCLCRLVIALAKLVFWPFAKATHLIEDKVENWQEAKKEKERAKTRVPRYYDRELREAEQEVELLLTQDERYSHHEV